MNTFEKLSNIIRNFGPEQKSHTFDTFHLYKIFLSPEHFSEVKKDVENEIERWDVIKPIITDISIKLVYNNYAFLFGKSNLKDNESSPVWKGEKMPEFGFAGSFIPSFFNTYEPT